jgi:hypothetical protein
LAASFIRQCHRVRRAAFASERRGLVCFLTQRPPLKLGVASFENLSIQMRCNWNRPSLVRPVGTLPRKRCQQMPVSSSTSARAAGSGLSPSQVIAACSVPMAPYRALRSRRAAKARVAAKGRLSWRPLFVGSGLSGLVRIVEWPELIWLYDPHSASSKVDEWSLRTNGHRN